PAAFHDLVVHAVPLDDPPGHVRRAAPAGGEPDGAVEGDPGLEPAGGEVALAAAGLPDALIRPGPVSAQPVSDLGDRHPALVRRMQALAVGEEPGIGGLAVDVELQLVGGAVADPDRAGAAPALEVVEGLLDQVGAAVDPVHDLQWPALPGVLGRAIAQPGPKRRG